jgi:hypothetical protein
MKSVSQSNNGRVVWISAYPKEMAKIKELVEILDAPENISVGSNSIATAFTPIELDYISATDFSNLLASLGLHKGITMTVYPKTLFVYVSGTEFTDIMTIKNVVDTENADVLGDAGTGDVPVINPDSDNTTNDEQASADDYVVQKIEFVNLERTTVESYIRTQVTDVKFYGHERMTKAVWMYAKQADIDKAVELIQAIDSSVPSAASTVHTYTAQNCEVETLMKRLSGVDIDGVTFETYDYSDLTNSIIVYCDEATWNNQVYDLIVAFDTEHIGDETWIPISSETADSVSKTEGSLNDKLNVMKELYPEVFDGVEYKLVSLTKSEATQTTVKTVLYAKTTSDKASRMCSLIEALENA